MAVLQRLALRGTPKATKKAARYTPAGGAERCGLCRHYAAPSACSRILGPVSASGWCQYFGRQVTYADHAGQATALGGPPGATLDLSFMTPGTLPPGVTFTRASGTASYFDVTGTMQSVSGNTPRWDYDPVTHVLKGLLIEASRTNLLLNSATLSTQSVAVTAQVYTLSFYGTGTITLSGASTAGPLAGTGAFPARVTLSFTPAAGTLTLTVTGTVQSAQLEAAAFASSYIPTAGSAAGRGNEITTALTGAWYTQGVGSLSTECIINGANGFPRIAEFNDGTTANEIMHYISASAGGLISASTLAGGAWTMGNNATYVANAVFKLASSWQAGAQLFNLNGIQPKSAAAAGVPLGITQLLLGHDNTGATTEVIWLRRFRYWPRALSASELQSVTT